MQLCITKMQEDQAQYQVPVQHIFPTSDPQCWHARPNAQRLLLFDLACAREETAETKRDTESSHLQAASSPRLCHGDERNSPVPPDQSFRLGTKKQEEALLWQERVFPVRCTRSKRSTKSWRAA